MRYRISHVLLLSVLVAIACAYGRMHCCRIAITIFPHGSHARKMAELELLIDRFTKDELRLMSQLDPPTRSSLRVDDANLYLDAYRIKKRRH
jgi:hypothetical protein